MQDNISTINVFPPFIIYCKFPGHVIDAWNFPVQSESSKMGEIFVSMQSKKQNEKLLVVTFLSHDAKITHQKWRKYTYKFIHFCHVIQVEIGLRVNIWMIQRICVIISLKRIHGLFFFSETKETSQGKKWLICLLRCSWETKPQLCTKDIKEKPYSEN